MNKKKFIYNRNGLKKILSNMFFNELDLIKSLPFMLAFYVNYFNQLLIFNCTLVVFTYFGIVFLSLIYADSFIKNKFYFPVNNVDGAFYSYLSKSAYIYI